MTRQDLEEKIERAVDGDQNTNDIILSLLWPFVDLAEDFVEKVHTGRARSVKTYAKCTTALQHLERLSE